MGMNVPVTDPGKTPQKALVTGASGFIGRRLRDALAARGVEVVTLRRPGSPPGNGVRAREADYDDLAALEAIVAEEKPDRIFHVAGVTKGRTLDDFRQGNVMPTENLLAAVRRRHPDLDRFVLVSSLACYGPSSPERPLREADPRRPVEHYGRSKMEAEQAVEAIGDALPWTIVRPSGVYGPGDVDYFELFKSAQRGVNAFFGNEHRWFSKIYVDDLIDAILAASESDATAGQGYFLCDGEPVTWGQFQEAVVEAVGRRVATLRLPELLVKAAAVGGELATRIDGKPRLFNRQKAKMGEQEAWTCTHDAARDDFGFVPTIDLHEGVRRTHAWYREHGWY